MDTGGPNAEQIRYWNERGAQWVALADQLDALIGPLGRRAMDRAGIAPGQRVLDIGCGCGDTTGALAERVGPSGRVVGVDISAVMLERARTRAAALAQATFELRDAQSHRFPVATFDLLFSRFGVMFFADPTAAFANLRAALRPDGRLTFVCWQALADNPWMLVPLAAAAPHVTLPPPPAPGAPGPFSFADAERVRGILSNAGFVDVGLEAVRETLIVGGGGLDDAVAFALSGVGPLAAAVREAGAGVVPTVTAAVREALTPYATADGVRMPAAAWIVRAQRG